MGRLTRVAVMAAAGVATLTVAALAQSAAYPADVRVPVKLTSGVSSSTSHPGDPFTFVTTKAVTLGSVAVPAGAAGTGRVAVAQPATDTQGGVIEIQADGIAEPGGALVSVNADAAKIYGHYVGKHRDIALDSGASFEVVTVEPRAGLAPLVTPSPSPVPSETPAAAASAAPAASESPRPATAHRGRISPSAGPSAPPLATPPPDAPSAPPATVPPSAAPAVSGSPR